MTMFLAVAIAVAAQWPGSWAESDVRPTAETIVAESLAAGDVPGAGEGTDRELEGEHGGAGGQPADDPEERVGER